MLAELAVNRKTANDVGLTILTSLLAAAAALID